MTNSLIQLLVLAAIAVFLILRLRSVLGTRDGFEPTQNDNPGPAEPQVPVEGDGNGDLSDHVDPDSPAYAALVAMRRIEPDFMLGPFLAGAKQAYEMILVAFERGDLTEIRPFLAPQVAQAFDSAIAARDHVGHQTEVQ
ncbi:MAG: Tim44/TimA family putative adaptor protein, partial [Paracoccus sp. (in: a-proteobacteria)]